MSTQSIASRMQGLQRDMATLNRQLIADSNKEAANAKRIVSIRSSIGSTTSASTIQGKLKDIQRIENENAHIVAHKADLTKRLADKNTEWYRLQDEMYKEQSKEQKRSNDIILKMQHQTQVRENLYLSEIRSLKSGQSVASGMSSAHEESSYDAFISHASEDKEDIVRPLAALLQSKGYKIWYDEFELKVGDSLRRKIDKGLSQSRYGIVVLSAAFFAKNWPQYELDGLVAKEMVAGKVILPIWHKVSKDEVMRYSPTLADRVALSTSIHTIEELSNQLGEVLRGS